ncbi:pyrroline-5-carboxylate reductase [Coralloluteibacterium stylophorae]|uniref:Pyrroline-5-carboxylate reductase n=1 Tax=Coralloluteibacterium stylophorae TaxID=1776034 RepID=A0A8J7VW68_9GAMM|nr:pyrroline-5-carboxylate reductase [Coralloluteibacterium stylophorae]MBS7456076.1 pyrroline-5-carboxylate reductase [Coralloluteibacterium stylophorae]
MTSTALPASRIAFIGGGNMAASLIGGLCAGSAPPAIAVADPAEENRARLASRHPAIAAHASNLDAADGAGVWVLAVKPQVLRTVCGELTALAQERTPLVISIAAGVTASQIDRWLGGGQAIVRAMPNTPSLLGAGATGLYANARVDTAGRAAAETLLATVGRTAWVRDEAQVDAVTAVSGSGPAYFFLLAEAMAEAGEEAGLDRDTARLLAAQTAFGAGRMLAESDEDAATLRRRVTSPGGTTQAAVEALESGGLRDVVRRAVAAAAARGRSLAAENDD